MTTLTEEREDVLQAIYERRAVRQYTAAPVPETTIRDLLDAAVQAPTAMHAEPWAFVVVQNKALLERLSSRAKTLLVDTLAAGGLSQHAATRIRLLAMLRDPGYNIFYDAGTLVVICRKPDGAFAEADCWLAAENLMLAACAKGLGTCCIGFAVDVLNAADVKQDLGIPGEIAAVVPIIVGFPRGSIEPVPRKPAQVLRWVK